MQSTVRYIAASASVRSNLLCPPATSSDRSADLLSIPYGKRGKNLSWGRKNDAGYLMASLGGKARGLGELSGPLMCDIRRAVNIPASRRREEPKSKLVVAVHTLASFASARRLSSSPPVSMGANERIYHRLEQSSGYYQIRHDNGPNFTRGCEAQLSRHERFFLHFP